jgi:hypothetical protein
VLSIECQDWACWPRAAAGRPLAGLEPTTAGSHSHAAALTYRGTVLQDRPSNPSYGNSAPAIVGEHTFEHRGCGVGPHCSFCGTFTGPFSEIEGLFTVLICIPCLEVRLAQPDTLLGLHDPGQPWEQWGCPIKGCGQWFLGPWELEWHTAAEHPGWSATYELLRPYPNQRQRVVYRRREPPAS